MRRIWAPLSCSCIEDEDLEHMKTSLLVAAGLLALTLMPALAQPPPGPIGYTTIGSPQPSKEMTRFDLDFSGGTPKDLVAAIQKALGRPLNAIVPDEYNDIQLPALKMSHVDVQQLFQALQQSSTKSEMVPLGPGMPGGYQAVQNVTYSYGFQPGPSPLSDDTIWYFHASKPPVTHPTAPAKVCRFYSLTPYLERNFTVDDITTAIETGWKMLGETSPPKISFHKDTKLLIAVGEPNKLEIIDSALKALEVPKAASAASGQPGKPAAPAKSAEPSKPSGE